jgi:hypothetical protein
LPEDVPRLAESGGVCRVHLGPVGRAPVEFGVDEGPDIVAIDRHVQDLAVDVDVGQLGAPHHHTAQDDAAEYILARLARPLGLSPDQLPARE